MTAPADMAEYGPTCVPPAIVAMRNETGLSLESLQLICIFLASLTANDFSDRAAQRLMFLISNSYPGSRATHLPTSIATDSFTIRCPSLHHLSSRRCLPAPSVSIRKGLSQVA